MFLAILTQSIWRESCFAVATHDTKVKLDERLAGCKYAIRTGIFGKVR